MNALPPSAARVQSALAEAGFENAVVEMPDSTRTAQEAADALGCTVAQIAKSILFRISGEDRALLVITSGANRVDEMKVSALTGRAIEKADADFVRDKTGFAIGGVPPIGHSEPSAILIDADLTLFEEIWAAAGTPRCVFKLTPDDLVNMTGGTVGEVRLD